LQALTLARLDDETARALIAAMGRLPALKSFAAETSDLSDDMHAAFEEATGGAASPSYRLVSLYE
jgi:hypothetical protein